MTTKTATTTTTTTTATVTTITTTITTTTTATTTTITTTTATTTTTTQKESGDIPLDSIDGIVYGVYNTRINQDSQALEPGDGFGNYPENESPAKACDSNIHTKYLTIGDCRYGQFSNECGLYTGLYLELQQGATLVTGLQICTADNEPGRDPLTVSLEGSNQSGSSLTLGSSWTLIYSGTSGLETIFDRRACGIKQLFNNSILYKSYRFLVLGKRYRSNSVQYSELKLFEY